MDEEETGKKGRKPLSITYVFENEKYLNILFLLYYCMLFRKKRKKKFLKQALVKDQFVEFGYTTKPFNSSYYWPTPEYPTEVLVDDHFKQQRMKQRVRHTAHRHRSKRQNKDIQEEQWSLGEVLLHRTAVTVYAIILQQKIRQCDLGFLEKKELDDFRGKKPDQFYVDNLFDTDTQLTKYLSTLKKKLKLINNYHDSRGTYWDITLRGYREITKLELILQIDDLFKNHFKYYEQNKAKIHTLLTPVLPPNISWIPNVPFETLCDR